jgi:hypothetical protein
MGSLSSLHGVLGTVPSTVERLVLESQFLRILIVACSPHKISILGGKS